MATITLYKVPRHATLSLLFLVRQQVEAAGGRCTLREQNGDVDVHIDPEAAGHAAIAAGLITWYEGWYMERGLSVLRARPAGPLGAAR